ncbi:hypothetical protein ACWKYH_06695 [Enterobacter sp. UPMP2076]
MDESRKQFEEWRISDSPTSNLYRDSHGQYAEIGTWIAWKAWQASRAAIEIKLPELKMLKDYLAEVTMREREDILVGIRLEFLRSIRAAGIRVKE